MTYTKRAKCSTAAIMMTKLLRTRCFGFTLFPIHETNAIKPITIRNGKYTSFVSSSESQTHVDWSKVWIEPSGQVVQHDCSNKMRELAHLKHMDGCSMSQTSHPRTQPVHSFFDFSSLVPSGH